jgi:hypothetical protein
MSLVLMSAEEDRNQEAVVTRCSVSYHIISFFSVILNEMSQLVTG